MRNAFAAEVTALAGQDGRVVLLSGDIGNRLFNDFKRDHPRRFFNCGVAEANMIGMASGLASCGLRPITYTIVPFTTTRCLEQIRVDVCYHDVPVIIVGVGGGFSYGELGPTHHSCEDVALLRALPNMTVVCPADAVETRLALRAALKQSRPTYIRIGKKGEPVVHGAEPDFAIGRSIRLRAGGDVCLLSAGTMLPEVLHAADLLAKRGIDAEVVSFHTVKPLDLDRLRHAFADFPLVATIEEHSLIGGLGSAVAEWLVDGGPRRARLLRFGTGDCFVHESGDQEHMRRLFGLSALQMADSITGKLRGLRDNQT